MKHVPMKLFTVTTYEWDGGSEMHYVDRQIRARDPKNARRRFKRYAKEHLEGIPRIVAIELTKVIS